MTIITDKKKAELIAERFADDKISMAIFCTASHWNTEAILMAANNYAVKHEIEKIPLAVAMTFNYPYMPQAQRVTYNGNATEGFISNMKHLNTLCSDPGSSYSRVVVLPHLDHADPARDIWALTKGTEYLSSVMFDAQKYPLGENIKMTQDYVKTYGGELLVEGIIDQLTVEGKTKGSSNDSYIERAVDYIKKTGVNFLVADLGTEQQSSGIGKCEYLSQRAVELTKAIGKPMLVLHGTSCLSDEQMSRLPEDGILRVNMWTRIAREAGQYAAHRVLARMDRINLNDFNACDTKAYIDDATFKAAEIMESILDILGYYRLAK